VIEDEAEVDRWIEKRKEGQKDIELKVYQSKKHIEN